ncbi:MAG: response regulator transcription factor [Pseudomonadota bacterium]
MTAQCPVPETTKIIIIDDDRKLCRLIGDYLASMGYIVDAAHDGLSGLDMIRQADYQAVILDVMMPGMDGFEVLKQLHSFSDIPVLMLTARGEETDRIVGLELGADDYLPKTFSPRELLARLRAVTRRFQKSAANEQRMEPGDILVHGDLAIDRRSRSVRLGNGLLTLTPVEYDLLVCLADAAGRVLTRDHLLDAVAGRDYDVFDRSVDVHISSLRKKLSDDPKQPTFIKTVRSVGYMFCPPGEETA